MPDQCIIAKGKDGKAKIRNLESCGGRVPEGILREKYAYCLMNNKNPTDIVQKGIEDTYVEIRKMENEINGVPGRRDIVPIKLEVGGEATAMEPPTKERTITA